MSTHGGPDYTREDLANALDDAADYIEKHGLWQGALDGPCGTVCSMGALTQVRPLQPNLRYRASRCLSHKTMQKYGKGIVDFNDDEEDDSPLKEGRLASPERQQKVLDVFRETAKELR